MVFVGFDLMRGKSLGLFWVQIPMGGDDAKSIFFFSICSKPVFETPRVVEGLDLSCLRQNPIL